MINNNLDEYILELSKRDRKSLVQKTLKLSEEAGELAKKVLPYEGAYGTNHRIVTPEKILEECADIMLVAQSIAHDLGFDSTELRHMMFKKAQVWDSIQHRENIAFEHSDLFPYEIHITVSGENGIDVDKFKLHCQNIGVKPIILELFNNSNGLVMDDMMTSSKIYGMNREAMNEAYRIAKQLSLYGYKVIRKKIESSYWHPLAPHISKGNPTMPNGCYFESHISVESDELNNITLSNIARKHNTHLSRNIFKKTDTKQIMMLTYRCYEAYEIFNTTLNNLLSDLKKYDYTYDKVIVEFSIFDDKQDHDQKWLEN